MIIDNKLIFTYLRDSVIFFMSPEGGRVELSMSVPIELTFTDAFGMPLDSPDGISCVFPKRGIYRVHLKGTGEEGSSEIDIITDGQVTPFLMPGPGVLWNHGRLFPLLPAKGGRHTLYVKRETAFDRQLIVVKGVPEGEDYVSVRDEKGRELSADWYPKLNHSWFWHSAEIDGSGCRELRVDIEPSKTDIRFALWHSYIVSLCEPKSEFATHSLTLAAYDEDGQRCDARFELFVGYERVAMLDILRNERPEIRLPEGSYRLLVTRGICFAPREYELRLDSDALYEPKLERVMTLPRGWFVGELHCHSAFEDAVAFPEDTMRAARCGGLGFCFQTDKDINALLRKGTSMHDLPGEFIGLAGQEIMCQEVHMNLLNTDRELPNPESDNLSRINPDINEKITAWLDEYREMKKRRPCTVMLNHPSHRPEVALKGNACFRSWWVVDVFREIGLVENFDARSWHDRLNRGYRLYGAWTGDGHDSSLMYPGKEGVCVYVGDELTAESVVSAIEAGRFFSLREPGMFLDINIGDTPMGGTAGDIAPGLRVTALPGRCEIDRVELIADGRVFKTIPGSRSDSLDITVEIPSDAHWTAAQAWVRGGEWEEETHSFTPHMTAGYCAFTNPIFIER